MSMICDINIDFKQLILTWHMSTLKIVKANYFKNQSFLTPGYGSRVLGYGWCRGFGTMRHMWLWTVIHSDTTITWTKFEPLAPQTSQVPDPKLLPFCKHTTCCPHMTHIVHCIALVHILLDHIRYLTDMQRKFVIYLNAQQASHELYSK